MTYKIIVSDTLEANDEYGAEFIVNETDLEMLIGICVRAGKAFTVERVEENE